MTAPMEVDGGVPGTHPQLALGPPAPPSPAFTQASTDDIQTQIAGFGSVEGTDPMDPMVNFKQRLIESVEELCNRYGGPRQYLNVIYSNKERREMFTAQMCRLVPLDESVA